MDCGKACNFCGNLHFLVNYCMNSEAQNIFIKNYDYPLPQFRIAEVPLNERDQSKLLIYRDGQIIDDFFYNVDEALPPDSTLILNNTRVIQARIFFRKPTGGIIEIFCLEPHQQTIEQSLACLLYTSPSP